MGDYRRYRFALASILAAAARILGASEGGRKGSPAGHPFDPVAL